MLNTNVSGTDKAMYALTRIRGIGRRFSNLILKKADVDLNKRAGELTEEEIENIKAIISNPLQFNIPEWFLNNRKDRKDGKTYQVGYTLNIYTYHSSVHTSDESSIAYPLIGFMPLYTCHYIIAHNISFPMTAPSSVATADSVRDSTPVVCAQIITTMRLKVASVITVVLLHHPIAVIQYN